MELVTGLSQDDAWGDLVATVLSLVVQHCTACSKDPKYLCSLLQVSTACRTALQRTRGHCSISITGAGTEKLSSCAAWLLAHPTLAEELHIADFSAACGTSDEVLAAAIAQLSNLKSVTIISRSEEGEGCSVSGTVVAASVVPDRVVESLTGLPQLTHLQLSSVSVGSNSSVPPTVQDLVLVVGAGADSSALEGLEGSIPLACLDFGHLPALLRLNVTASLPEPSDESYGFALFDDAPSAAAAAAVAGFALKLPAGLTSLQVSGPIMEICCAAGSEFAGLLEYEASGSSMSVSKLAAFVASAPKLSRLQLERHMRLSFGFCVEPMKVEDAALLAAAVGSAAQLTSLRIQGCQAGSGFAALSLAEDSSNCVQWGKYAAQLKELRELDLGEMVLQAADLLALTSLTKLTALSLKSCSPSIQAHVFYVVCSELTQMQELYLGKSANLSMTGPNGEVVSLSGTGSEVFPAVAQLTKLRVLSLGDIHGMSCSEADLQLLKTLTCLTALILPPKAEAFDEAAFAGFMADMPALNCIQADQKILLRGDLLA